MLFRSRLGLVDAAAVRVAFSDVSGRAPEHAVLVQRMERGVAECLVGFSRDDVFGPLITVATGGLFVEVLRDAAMRLAPVALADAREMIASLRGAPLLEGARGRERADVAALADLIVRVSHLACDRPEVAALDLNPVVVRAAGEGAVAVDALVVTSGDVGS